MTNAVARSRRRISRSRRPSKDSCFHAGDGRARPAVQCRRGQPSRPARDGRPAADIQVMVNQPVVHPSELLSNARRALHPDEHSEEVSADPAQLARRLPLQLALLGKPGLHLPQSTTVDPLMLQHLAELGRRRAGREHHPGEAAEPRDGERGSCRLNPEDRQADSHNSRHPGQDYQCTPHGPNSHHWGTILRTSG
jgi:hypothetical protein